LIASAVVLPFGLFWRNVHLTTLKKCVLWTPVVPLIMLQCILRTGVLFSVVEGASDRVLASIYAFESLVLCFQVGVFLLMDAMRHPTPKLRIGFAMMLLVRFVLSLSLRSTSTFGAEQAALFDEGSWLRARLQFAGSSTKQSIIGSIDWTLTLMLSSSILSVLNYPGEMAVVRLRCDTRGYSNWRDQYLGDMAIRAHRRELDVADRVAWLRAKLTLGALDAAP